MHGLIISLPMYARNGVGRARLTFAARCSSRNDDSSASLLRPRLTATSAAGTGLDALATQPSLWIGMLYRIVCQACPVRSFLLERAWLDFFQRRNGWTRGLKAPAEASGRLRRCKLPDSPAAKSARRRCHRPRFSCRDPLQQHPRACCAAGGRVPGEAKGFHCARARTHARTRARAHARTHARTHSRAHGRRTCWCHRRPISAARSGTDLTATSRRHPQSKASSIGRDPFPIIRTLISSFGTATAVITTPILIMALNTPAVLLEYPVVPLSAPRAHLEYPEYPVVPGPPLEARLLRSIAAVPACGVGPIPDARAWAGAKARHGQRTLAYADLPPKAAAASGACACVRALVCVRACVPSAPVSMLRECARARGCGCACAINNHGRLKAYSRGTRRVVQGYSRGTHGVLEG